MSASQFTNKYLDDIAERAARLSDRCDAFIASSARDDADRAERKADKARKKADRLRRDADGHHRTEPLHFGEGTIGRSGIGE
jgi:hypothetical protein